MQPSYKADLTPMNERTHPLRCMACKRRAGLVWRGTSFLCYDCDKASAPVVLDWPTILDAAVATDQPIVTARTAVEALERCVGRA
jgi:hypothetical protein